MLLHCVRALQYNKRKIDSLPVSKLLVRFHHTILMEGFRNRSPDMLLHRKLEMREHLREASQHYKDLPKITTANGSRLTAPVAIYPYQRSRNQSSIDQDERGLSTLRRPAVGSHLHASPSSRKPYKSYSISEILKSTEQRENDESVERRSPVNGHCFQSRESTGARESPACWGYDPESSSPSTQNCTACCQCYSSIRYPYSVPYRSWPMTISQERETFHCGYSSTGMY